MSQFLSNIGPADELRERVMKSIGHADLFILLDKSRTVMVNQIIPKRDEIDVLCTDENDKTTIVLHLPYAANSVAQAHLIFYPKGE